jgi:hypothetical protein
MLINLNFIILPTISVLMLLEYTVYDSNYLAFVDIEDIISCLKS